ncbi:MAG: hypothetical protein AVDCRST_MAG64-1093 [uncultured Phycisphaerae bacterium]|uniref:Uncharacterized protein n=1 Tax=uncultured Phycisphaerae bacterium TaxID=904963 RepID=A0A6J4NII6_9BACT|nr:MAG: hypothetical protein AVDCRST_MAG64-1093 [uncultured Phycisphaerae bacterium]
MDDAAKALAVTCNQCGAALDLPAATRFVTCTYCGTRLEVRRAGGAAYTEILESIHERTEQIAGDVEHLRRQNELEQVDREWMMRRESLMVSTKHGGRHVPSGGAGLIVAALAAVFGVVWIGIAISMGAPIIFPLFGFVFVAVAVINGVTHVRKAGEYQQAEADYERRRRQLQRELDDGR